MTKKTNDLDKLIWHLKEEKQGKCDMSAFESVELLKAHRDAAYNELKQYTAFSWHYEEDEGMASEAIGETANKCNAIIELYELLKPHASNLRSQEVDNLLNERMEKVGGPSIISGIDYNSIMTGKAMEYVKKCAPKSKKHTKAKATHTSQYRKEEKADRHMSEKKDKKSIDSFFMWPENLAEGAASHTNQYLSSGQYYCPRCDKETEQDVQLEDQAFSIHYIRDMEVRRCKVCRLNTDGAEMPYNGLA